MSDKVRFTTWLSERERDCLDEAARQQGTSVNFIVRMAVRSYLGLNKDTQSSQLSQVTNGGHK